ncbi:thymidine kinase, cytosolic-like [Neocloeon triangulifer]|uniref:thymidine kinase, cytosolic-like n=1 Tax=Neocloeon triangulifer TaxID=2078957 RepID=UPI00286ECF8A|nr:thymidine kinase, cytosolic-like [Neocloeon triangulifer]
MSKTVSNENNVHAPQRSPCRRQQGGQIQVIFGPMFSGKTTELIRRMKRYQVANKKCLVFKYSGDTRYDNVSLSTHDQQKLPAISASNLLEHMDIAMMYDVVGIDEGQFFSGTVEFCEKLADCGKMVVVAALDGTYQRQGFGNILHLVPLAESVEKLTAVCMMCFGNASYTKRIGNEQEVEVIGGADKYMAVCRSCYHKSPSKAPRSPLKQFNDLNNKCGEVMEMS